MITVVCEMYEGIKTCNIIDIDYIEETSSMEPEGLRIIFKDVNTAPIENIGRITFRYER